MLWVKTLFFGPVLPRSLAYLPAFFPFAAAHPRPFPSSRYQVAPPCQHCASTSLSSLVRAPLSEFLECASLSASTQTLPLRTYLRARTHVEIFATPPSSETLKPFLKLHCLLDESSPRNIWPLKHSSPDYVAAGEPLPSLSPETGSSPHVLRGAHPLVPGNPP